MWVMAMAGHGKVRPIEQSITSEVPNGTGGSGHRWPETGDPARVEGECTGSSQTQ